MRRDVELLAVGVVTGTHGVSGALKVKSLSGLSDHLLALREAEFRSGRARRLLAVEWVRPRPAGIILKASGIETPEEARRMVGHEIWVSRRQAAPLLEGEYYTADLCRCSVWFGEEEVGQVRSVWDGGAAQLLEVQGRSGEVHLVPFTDHFVGEVDVARGRIVLREDEVIR